MLDIANLREDLVEGTTMKIRTRVRRGLQAEIAVEFRFKIQGVHPEEI